MRKRTNSLILLALAILFCVVAGWDAIVPEAYSRPQRFSSQNPPSSTPKRGFPRKDSKEALRSGNLKEAEEDFRHVLVLDPKAGAAYANLGVIEMRRKNWDEALKNLQKAQTFSPNVPGVRLKYWPPVEFRRGNYAEGDAIPVLQSVVRDEPAATQPRYLLGLCQVFTEAYAAAVKTLEPMWESMANDVMYLYVLDMAADKSGEKQLDEKVMRQMVTVGGDTPEFHLILAKAHLQHHEHDAAFEELKKVEAMNPSMPFLHFNFGYAYLGAGEFTRKVKQNSRKDISIDPDLADNYLPTGSSVFADAKAGRFRNRF